MCFVLHSWVFSAASNFLPWLGSLIIRAKKLFLRTVHHKRGVAAHACDSSTGEAEAGVWDQPGLQRELKVKLNDRVRPSLKKTKKEISSKRFQNKPACPYLRNSDIKKQNKKIAIVCKFCTYKYRKCIWHYDYEYIPVDPLFYLRRYISLLKITHSFPFINSL